MSAVAKFLSPYKVEKGSVFSHTSLKGGAYYIPADEEEDFLKVYTQAIVNGEELSITEKHRDISPVLIDLDFRHDTPYRLYTEKHLLEFINALKRQLVEYVEVNDDMLRFYVLEKPEPRKNKSGGFKDGVHIVCPYITTKPEVQHIIRQNILNNNEMKLIFDNTFTNSYDDIYDKAVIEHNNWFMYGSKKPDEEYPWVVSKIYDANLKEVDCEHTDEELVELLSIRNKFDSVKVKPDKVDEVKSYKESKQKPKIDEASTSKATAHIPSDLETVHKLAMMLSVERADNYDDWIRVGWCLKNIDERLCPAWIQFSEKSSKFVDGECEKLWATFGRRQGGLTEGALRFWAKHDNPEAYNKLQRDGVEHLIYVSRNETHTDIAKVVHYLLKDTFVCCYSNDKPFWFEFKGHKWVQCPDGVSLKIKISNEISKHYSSEATKYNVKAQATEEESQQIMYLEIAKKLTGIATKLKMAHFKNNIFKECKELFYLPSKDFYEKLDENKYLLGFENGVYDFEAGCFRDGMPTDFITYSVGYDYIHEPDTDYMKVLKDLIYSMFPTDVIPYMLNTNSYALTGNKYMEFLQFWIGTGANGKGVLSKLLQKTFGEYCYCPDVSVFTTKKTSSSSANPELAKTKGKRLLIATEPSEDDKFQVGAIKAWTGGDTIQARALYKDNIEFTSQFLIIIQMNHKPELSDFDMGIARRLKNVEFPYKFVSDPKLPHERQGDSGLKKKIEDDIKFAQNFMWLLIENYKENLSGNRAFETPERVQQFTQEYLDANNKIGAFLAECCEITNDNNDVIRTQTLFDEFKMSSHYNGKDIKNFVEHMGHCGYKATRHKQRASSLRDKMVFYGIKIKTQGILIEDDEYEL